MVSVIEGKKLQTYQTATEAVIFYEDKLSRTTEPEDVLNISYILEKLRSDDVEKVRDLYDREHFIGVRMSETQPEGTSEMYKIGCGKVIRATKKAKGNCNWYRLQLLLEKKPKKFFPEKDVECPESGLESTLHGIIFKA